MRLMATWRAVGHELARDARDGRAGELPLLRAGATLTDEYADRLARAGINAVFVDDEVSADIEVTPALTEKTRVVAESKLTLAFRAVPAALATGVPLSEESLREFKQVAAMIAQEVAAADDAVVALQDLASADAYTLQHSINVTVTGLILARRHFRDHGRLDGLRRRSFRRMEEALTRLGVGLLLHDVGKLAIPRAVLEKAGPLDDDEWELMKRHTLLGVELIRSDAIGYHAKAVIRSHHERWDGRGYPDGISRERIPEFARIAAIADVYDAITSERSYRRAASPASAHAAIVSGAGHAFDPHLVDVFRRTIAPYPPGSEVTLHDGREGIVVRVDPKHIERPVVRVLTTPDGEATTPRDVNLAENDWIRLVPPTALLRPVRPGLPAAEPLAASG